VNAKRLLFRVWARLPRRVRRNLVRLGTPSHTVGAMGIVEDGERVLLVQLSYRRGWGLPVGLLQRGEQPAAALVREVAEEVGIAVELLGVPTVVVESRVRRVDIVFRCRPAPGVDPASAVACSAEIIEARWWPSDDLPPLHAEAAEAFRVSRSLR
jgi:ADP-ribose pyrophosphatase YjhB (NUDIX family)